MKNQSIFFVLLLFIVSCKEKITTPATSVTKIEIYDPELLEIIDTNAVIEVLADGFKWSEGPLWYPGDG